MSFDSNLPIYLQLIEKFERKIIAGHYPPGSSLPSRREVAQQYKVNPNTVQRAFVEMQTQKLLIAQPNAPSRVTTDEELLHQLRQKEQKRLIQSIIREVNDYQLDPEEILQSLIEEWQVDEKCQEEK